MSSPSLAVPAPGLVPGLVPALPVVPLRQVVPWLVFAAAMLGVIYFAFLDQGAVSIIPGRLLHEFAHDGRHLFGFPCH